MEVPTMKPALRIRLLLSAAFMGCITVAGTSLAGEQDRENKEAAKHEESNSKQVSERLRHKERAVSTRSVPAGELTQSEPKESAAAQHRESDLNFVNRSAKPSSTPRHTPEWTNPGSSDPGRSGKGEKGGTEDINIGVGELRKQPDDTFQGRKKKEK